MIEALEAAALNAGRSILELYRSGCSVQEKADGSLVTEADLQAEIIIRDLLAGPFPDIPIVAEEAASTGTIPNIHGGRFFLVDPLDGTIEFVDRTGEFTVNIALIDDGQPVGGVVYAPALGIAFSAERGKAEALSIAEDQRIVRRAPIKVRPRESPPVAAVSRSHNSPDTRMFLNANGVEICRTVGSSLKFCLVASGIVDVYPRFGRTMEWDTAAGDAVLRAAGGTTALLDGTPLLYGKRHQESDHDFSNPPFVAWGAT